MKQSILVVAALALMMTGCGGVTVEPDASYASLADLRDAAKAAGVPCAEWKELSSDGSVAKGMCDGASVLAVDTGGKIDPKAVVMSAMLTGITAGQDPVMLYAQNWVLSASPDVARRAQRGMGGEEYAWSELSGKELLEGLSDE